jgi:hypothetical protein
LIEEYGNGEQATVDRYRVGNMALLAGPQNSVNSNKSFSEKISTFSSSTFLSTQMIVKSFAGQGTFLTEASLLLPPSENWNRDALDVRAKGVHELLCKCLDLAMVEPGEYVGSSSETERQIDNRIPQADDPLQMLAFLIIVSDGNEITSDIAIAAAAETRHTTYYLTALSIIGLIESDEGAWQVTEEGAELLTSDDLNLAMRRAILDSPLMIAWSSFESSAEKDSFLAAHDLSGATINRRKTTLDNWVAWCASFGEES